MVLGNLIQINARGEQERLLYGNPQMTYFKKVFRNSNNFSRSYLNIPLSGTSNFGNKIHIDLPHNGDLLANLYLSLTLPLIREKNGGSDLAFDAESGYGYYCNGIGYKIIKSIEIKFNGKQIEKLTGEMISHIYNLQYSDIDKETLNRTFKFSNENNYKLSYVTGTDDNLQSRKDIERRGPINLDIPIPFFFSKKSHSYLPLCAMSNTNIEIIIEIEKLENLIFGNDESDATKSSVIDYSSITPISNFKVISEVINLDLTEKRLFTTNELTYLVKLNNIIATELLDGYTQGNITIDLNGKNAINMIYFTLLPDINERFRDYFNYSIDYLIDDKIEDPTSNTLFNFHSSISKPLLYKSTNNKLIEDFSIEADNNKIVESGLLSLNFLNNISSFNKNNNKSNYQIFTYNFNLGNSEEVNGSLNFSRLLKKTINFKVGQSFKDYINNTGGYSVTGSTWDNLFVSKYHRIIFNCYSCYYNYLIIKDGLSGLKYN